jgi:hypothetical protein
MHYTASRQREYDRMQGLQKARTAARVDKMPLMDGRTIAYLGHLLRFFTGHTITFESEQKNSN